MFKEISAYNLPENPFKLIGKDWMLVTAGTVDNCNTMTASWGAVGVIWGKPSATAYIRESRYTKEFVDAQEYFTLSFFAEGPHGNKAVNKELRHMLNYCGSTSGRDEDKIATAGLTVFDALGVDADKAQNEGGSADKIVQAPAFEQASMILVCKKQYVLDMPLDAFVDTQNVDAWYPDGNPHTAYIGSIEKVLVKE